MGQIADFIAAFTETLDEDGYVTILFGRQEIKKMYDGMRVLFVPASTKYDSRKQNGNDYVPLDGYTAIETYGTTLMTFAVVCFAQDYDEVFKLHQKCQIALQTLYSGSLGTGEDIFSASDGEFSQIPDITAVGETLSFTVTIGFPLYNKPFDTTTIHKIKNSYHYTDNQAYFE